MEGPEEILLDMNELAKSHKFVGLGAFAVSDDQNMLAYTVDFTGFRQYMLQVKDLRTGETLPDTIERVDSVVWAADNRTLFLTTEDAVTKRSDKLWRHALGAAVLRSHLRREGRAIRHRRGKNARQEISAADDIEQGHHRVSLAARGSTRRATSRSSCRARRNIAITWIIARTCSISARNKDGRNFAIMTAPESDPARKNWKVFIPQRDDVLIRASGSVPGFRRVASRKSQRCRPTAHLRFQERQVDGRSPFPEPVYAASPGGTPDFDFADLPLQLPELHDAAQRLTITTCTAASPRC